MMTNNDDTNVANNVVQPKVQDLTEQWKKGELEQGYYYTRYNPKVGEPFVEIELRNYLLDLAKVRDAETVEVLAPVPSYDDWVYLHKARNDARDKFETVLKENQQLKEMLEEAKDIIEWYKGDCGYKDAPTEAILTKIDNAIGEKK